MNSRGRKLLKTKENFSQSFQMLTKRILGNKRLTERGSERIIEPPTEPA